jgi:hypothetical protein
MRTPALIVAFLALGLQSPRAIQGAGQSQRTQIQPASITAQIGVPTYCQRLALERPLITAAVLTRDAAALLDESERPSPADF